MEGSDSNTNSTGSPSSLPSSMLKRKSSDVGWEYGELINPHNLDKVKCKLCNKQCSGGIYRLKQHIAGIQGNIKACSRATPRDKDRCRAAIQVGKKKKQEKNDKELREEVQKVKDAAAGISGLAKKSRHILEPGPVDHYVPKEEDPEASVDLVKRTRQQNIHDAFYKRKGNEVHTYLARWVYESGVSFDVIDNASFHCFVEAVGQLGPGYIPPSQFQLREPLLKQEVEKTKKSLENQEEEWARGGCSLMVDSWTHKRRWTMNFCINCKYGTSFISSIEDWNEVQTGQYIFNFVDKYIGEIGPQNVLQVVTGNDSNNMDAAKILKEKRPNIFWTSCATDSLNLILEAIGKTSKFKRVIEKAKALITFIYSHHKTLTLMRKFTKKRHIIRPGVTRFASTFLTLQSMFENRENLRFMFVCDEWDACKWSKTLKGRNAYATIVNPTFWTDIGMCVDVFKPLVKVLRRVSEDWKPSMGFVVGQINDAKEEIRRVCKEDIEMYEALLEIIDTGVRNRLDSPLHLAGYFLNPYYYFKDGEIGNDPCYMDAFVTCIEAFFPSDETTQNVVANMELLKYKNCSGLFGHNLAIMDRETTDANFDPVGWWSIFGVEAPKLQKMAMKILSLTSSSSGCERNWTTCGGNHPKTWKSLDAERLKDLVYVQMNAKLLNRKKRLEENGDDILLASDTSMAQGWIVEGGGDEEEEEEASRGSSVTGEVVGDTTGADKSEQPHSVRRDVRELEDEFNSDDETDGEVDDDEENGFEYSNQE